MASTDPRQEGRGDGETNAASGYDLAGEVERARTPSTPLLALTGVWLVVAVAVALVVAIVVLAMYLV